MNKLMAGFMSVCAFGLLFWGVEIFWSVVGLPLGQKGDDLRIIATFALASAPAWRIYHSMRAKRLDGGLSFDENLLVGVFVGAVLLWIVVVLLMNLAALRWLLAEIAIIPVAVVIASQVYKRLLKRHHRTLPLGD